MWEEWKKAFHDRVSKRDWSTSRPCFTVDERQAIAACLERTRLDLFKGLERELKEKFGEKPKFETTKEDLFNKTWKDMQEAFIHDLQDCCLWLRGVLPVNPADHQAKLKDAVKAFRKSMKYLEEISAGKFYLPLSHRVENADPMNFIRDTLIRNASAKGALLQSSIALDALKIVEKVASESFSRNPHGVYARAWVEFVRLVAFRYFFWFRLLPTESPQGPFWKLLELLRGIMGFEQKLDMAFNPRRAIAKARAEIKRYQKNIEIS
jgi:hypothetical protein